MRNSWVIPPEFHPHLDAYFIHYYTWEQFWTRTYADLTYPLNSTRYKIYLLNNTRIAARCPTIIASFRKALDPKISEPIVIIKGSVVPVGERPPQKKAQP
jgi:hypothetical protein